MSTRSPRSARKEDGETPAAFERDLRSLADVARNPFRQPLATAVAALVVCALGYQSYAVALAAGPVAGLLSVAAVAVAYAVAKRLWAVQHRYMVAELAAADELDRLR
jgi:small-conductance mechanosensitive channel